MPSLCVAVLPLVSMELWPTLWQTVLVGGANHVRPNKIGVEGEEEKRQIETCIESRLKVGISLFVVKQRLLSEALSYHSQCSVLSDLFTNNFITSDL